MRIAEVAGDRHRFRGVGPKIPGMAAFGRCHFIGGGRRRWAKGLARRMGPDEIGELIDRLAGPLGLYARQWCDSGEDVVQEAFLKLAGQGQPGPKDSAAWLFRAVRNGSINVGIAAARRRRHEAEAAARGRPWFEADHPLVDPDRARLALETLPDPQREVVVAHLWGGLTFEQVATLTGASASTCHRLYRSALLTLKSRLEEP